jgi:hypothetical protein
MTPRIVHPTIADRFINEVPRFFGGWLPTLREIFQNAYRAGATEVRVTSDATQTVLTITDNGRGCPEVEALMTIGRSDWDEMRVVEAAGMGFVSVLNGALIERVTARSAAWRAEWKCQPKALAPAKVYDAEPMSGFSLTLTLKQQHTELAADVQRARAFYPFTVTFNDVVVEARSIASDVLFETPVGRVLWKQGTYTDPAAYTAVWEHRDLKAEAFAHALHAAFQQQPRELRAAFDHYPQFVWFVDPACGVTPKLPDRNDLQDDAHLAAAARLIAQTCCDHVVTVVKGYAESLPDTVETDSVKGLARYLDRNTVLNILRDHLGWSRLTVDDFSTVSVQWENCEDGPGTYPTLETESRYDTLVRTERAIPIRPSEADTLGNWLALNHQLRGLRVAGDDQDVKASEAVKIVGQKRKPGSHIATAQRITWQGLELPFYLNSQACLSEDKGQPLIVLTGDARQMLHTYRTYAETFRGWLLHVADEDGYLSEWCAEEFDEWSADTDHIDDTLQADILAYGSRAQRQAQQREVAARAVLHGLHGARHQLAQISRDLRVSREVDALVPGLLKQVQAAIQRAQAEQQRLAALVEQQTTLNPEV